MLPSCSSTRKLPQRNENSHPHEDYANVHSSRIRRSPKLEATQMTVDRKANTMWSMHAMECASAMKCSDVLIQPAARMEPENSRRKPGDMHDDIWSVRSAGE